MASNLPVLLIDARHLLMVSQGKLGEMLGSSQRTGQRWDTGRARPSNEQLHHLAGLIHPKDAELAKRIASAGGATLEQLGIVRPPPPPPPPPPPFTPDPEHMVDTIVCAAADAMAMTPEGIRPALRAAFRRARLVGLSVETVDAALNPSSVPEKSPGAGSKKRTS